MLVACCMCYEKISVDTCCIPVKCLILNGAKAHRICSNCWWNSSYGFAREDGTHKCPGCTSKMMLTECISAQIVVVLTDDLE